MAAGKRTACRVDAVLGMRGCSCRRMENTKPERSRGRRVDKSLYKTVFRGDKVQHPSREGDLWKIG